MTVSSFQFLLPLLLVGAFFFYLPGGWLRRLVFSLGAFFFLAQFIPNSWTWVCMAFFLLSGYAWAHLVKARKSSLLFAGYLITLVAAFIYMQRYEFLTYLLPDDTLQHSIVIVGLSYMLFRQIHFIVDMMQDQIPSATLWTYLNYQLNPFGLLAGPIARYQEFAEFWNSPTPILQDRHDVLVAYLRVFVGVIKIAGLAAATLFLYDKVSTRLLNVASGAYAPGRLATTGMFLMVFYTYPIYIYLNFSGYCDIVIGGAALLGLRMPENFDRPYLARNMIDYWNRWHRTLSFWIRDYIFMPSYKAIAERWPRQASEMAFLCYFLALFLAGIWHGSTLNWVIFGVLNGAGVAAAKLWENSIVKHRGRQGLRAYLQSRPIRVLAVIANVHFACLTILFFPADLEKCLRIIGALFASNS